MSKPKDLSYAFNLASKQRFEALKNAFKTIRVFAEPSCNPVNFKAFEDLEKYLLKMYSNKRNFPK